MYKISYLKIPVALNSEKRQREVSVSNNFHISNYRMVNDVTEPVWFRM
jgi:hypothetical protein